VIFLVGDLSRNAHGIGDGRPEESIFADFEVTAKAQSNRHVVHLQVSNVFPGFDTAVQIVSDAMRWFEPALIAKLHTCSQLGNDGIADKEAAHEVAFGHLCLHLVAADAENFQIGKLELYRQPMRDIGDVDTWDDGHVIHEEQSAVHAGADKPTVGVEAPCGLTAIVSAAGANGGCDTQIEGCAQVTAEKPGRIGEEQEAVGEGGAIFWFCNAWVIPLFFGEVVCDTDARQNAEVRGEGIARIQDRNFLHVFAVGDGGWDGGFCGIIEGEDVVEAHHITCGDGAQVERQSIRCCCFFGSRSGSSCRFSRHIRICPCDERHRDQ